MRAPRVSPQFNIAAPTLRSIAASILPSRYGSSHASTAARVSVRVDGLPADLVLCFDASALVRRANSLKHSPQGQSVIVRLETSESAPMGVNLAIIDRRDQPRLQPAALLHLGSRQSFAPLTATRLG